MGKHSESTTQFRDVYVEITNRILAAMENAKRWEKPWQPGFGSDGKQLSRPINVTTGKPTVESTSRS
jgi:antirestriction protein ArdC